MTQWDSFKGFINSVAQLRQKWVKRLFNKPQEGAIYMTSLQDDKK